MNCPKCEAPMRNYERNGINIDQCTGCKGVFLDRGELEHLMSNEDSFYSQPAPSGRAPQQFQQSDQQYQQSNQQSQYPKKKKNFLGEIFDF